MQRKNKHRTNKKTLIFALMALLGLLLVLLLLELKGVTNLYSRDTAPVSNEEPTVNLEPPTETDKAEVDQNKERLGSEQSNQVPADQNDGKKSVTPVISYIDSESDPIAIKAFIVGTIENDGTCSLTLTNGLSTINKTVTSVADATTTNCPAFEIPRSEFVTSGSWTAIVSFYSASSKGESAQQSLEVR